MFGNVGNGRIEMCERVKHRRRVTSHAERVEDMDRSEPLSQPVGYPGILTFRINADDRVLPRQKIGNDRSDTLSRARWCHRHQMRWPVISQKLHRSWITANQETMVMRPPQQRQIARSCPGCRTEYKLVRCLPYERSKQTADTQYDR